MARDLIELLGLTAFGHHGVFDHERRDGQEFKVDIILGLDLTEASRTDELTATVDYGKLADRAVAIMGGEPVNLIETLAQRIIDCCLEFDRVEWARVKLHKPQAPIAAAFTDVVVTIERSRT